MTSSAPVGARVRDYQSDRRTDLHWAAGGGVVAAIISFGGMAVVGSASSAQARRLLEGVLPSARFAASAYVAGGATILALMLTLITFSISHELEFRTIHYKRIRDIGAVTSASIIGSVLLLVFMSFPIAEADVERGWYVWLYYAVLLGCAITGGAFISAVLMIFYGVRSLITLAVDSDASELVVDDGDDGDERGVADDQAPRRSRADFDRSIR